MNPRSVLRGDEFLQSGRGWRTNLARLVVLGPLAALGLSGCGGVPATFEETPVKAFSKSVNVMIDEARAGEASANQLELLENASATGRVTLEVVKESANAAVSCMATSGVKATYVEHVTDAGLVVPGYDAIVSRSATPDVADTTLEEIVDDCDRHNFYWISTAYQVQPSAIEAVDRYLAGKVDILAACLDRYDVSHGPDATPRELARLAAQLDGRTGNASGCLDEAGITGF